MQITLLNLLLPSKSTPLVLIRPTEIVYDSQVQCFAEHTKFNLLQPLTFLGALHKVF
jgi:hypothetical protein